MPVVAKHADDPKAFVLPIVAHLSSGQEAVLELRGPLQKAAVDAGGSAEDVHVLMPSITRKKHWGIQWVGGPEGWADLYQKDENSQNSDFTCETDRGHTIYFKDT